MSSPHLDPTSSAPPAGALRILVIDDEAGVRDVLCELLSEEGHHVTAAASGAEGLACFGAGTFDVVITDLAMPKLDGLEVTREVRRRDPMAICILTSGWIEQRSRAGLDPSIADLVLHKPFHFDEVISSVARAAALRRERVAESRPA